MEGRSNRKVIVRDCLAYCEPGKEPVIFVKEHIGTIALHPVITNKPGNTSINEIFIPEGYDKVETEIPREEMLKFWAKGEDNWKKLAQYLNKD
jgi:XTP/dITP diphosphohydrolase